MSLRTGLIGRIRGAIWGIVTTVLGFGFFLYLILSASWAPSPIQGMLIALPFYTQSDVGSALPMNTGQFAITVVLTVICAIIGGFGLLMLRDAIFEDNYYHGSPHSGPP